MRKITNLLLALTAFSGAVIAAPVPVGTAQKVAANFYSQNSSTSVNSISLAYTETDNAGNALYYVFNVNGTSGFVIVSADDALHPIIGYSNEGRPFITPEKGTNMEYWMQKRKVEIMDCKANKMVASPDITDEWVSYAANKVPQNVVKNKNRANNGNRFPAYKLSHTPSIATPFTVSAKEEGGARKALSNTFPSSTAFLVQSTWDQSSPYNSSVTAAPYAYNGLTPGHSVTGCVATTMAQIMRYWQYPAKGTGSYSYCDCTASGDQVQYGTQSVTFSNMTYHWTNNMPYNPSTVTDVDTLMYDAGVSVAMNYSTTGSSAYVITADAGGGQCAQKSYPTYFGYTINILHGMDATSMSATAWQDTLETELNKGRPIQYAGQASDGGHTWVCDGFNSSNQFHMNWGWGGGDDGWYALTALTPAGSLGTQPTFNTGLEALIGIMPPITNPTCFGKGVCDTATNLPAKPELTYYNVGTNEFCTGTYGDTIQQIADYFGNPPCSGFSIGSVEIYFYKTKSTNAGRTVNVNIWDNTGLGGAPGAILATKSVLVSSLSTTGPTDITFASAVSPKTPYYVGVDFTTLAANYKTDTLIIVTDTASEGSATAWQYDVAAAYGLNGWNPTNSVWGINLSHAIWANLCTPLDVQGISLDDAVKLYPNPTTSIVTAEVALDQTSDVNVEVYNTLGQMVQQAHWGNVSNTTRTIDLSGQATGMYFVKLITAQSTITKKVMLNR